MDEEGIWNERMENETPCSRNLSCLRHNLLFPTRHSSLGKYPRRAYDFLNSLRILHEVDTR